MRRLFEGINSTYSKRAELCQQKMDVHSPLLSDSLQSHVANVSQAETVAWGFLQLLKIAIRNIMAAPVRNSIELNAMGELHLVLRLKPLALTFSLLVLSASKDVSVLAGLYASVVGKFVGFAVVTTTAFPQYEAASIAVCKRSPSSFRLAGW